MDRRLLGAVGESMAAAAYRKRGYALLAANYRTRLGEVDLIAQKGGTLVFIEVKTRAGKQIARPMEFVTPAKQKRIILAAQAFLTVHPALADSVIRFDVYEVWQEGGRCAERCIENAFSL